jgi:hypothetical protein
MRSESLLRVITRYVLMDCVFKKEFEENAENFEQN